MNELALFAGAGGGILGGKLLGWRTVCGVERDAYAASVLAQRQNDGLLDPFPIWSDVSTFNGYPWQGIVEVVSGGFPCQDISVAGKGNGITGSRSGLWKEFVRIIREVRPRFVFVENSPALTSRGIDTVLGDLATLGFDAEWGVLGASDVGAPHKRLRIWIVANSRSGRRLQPQSREIQQSRRAKIERRGETLADTDKNRRMRWPWVLGKGWWNEFTDSGGNPNTDSSRKLQPERSLEEQRNRTCHFCLDVSNADMQRLEEWHRSQSWQTQPTSFISDWWATEPDVGRVAHGVAFRVDRIAAIGNGQVPLCAAEAFRQLQERLNK